MKSQHLLSNDQHSYLTSQDKVPNPSEQRKRIAEKIEQAFNTFDIILTNQSVSPKFIDELFPSGRIFKFLQILIRFDQENLLQDERNKQEIARQVIDLGFNYFKDRYKETFLIQKQIEEMDGLLRMIQYVSDSEQADSEAMELYRTRIRAKKPPHIVPEKDFWVAECIYCFNYSYGTNKTEKEAIQNLNHQKGCLFLKDVKKFGGEHKDMEIWRYIRTISPRDN